MILQPNNKSQLIQGKLVVKLYKNSLKITNHPPMKYYNETHNKLSP